MNPFAQNLNLILYKTYADLRAESERTYAGFAWWIVEPILHMVVYYVVFEVFLNRGTENYFAFLLVGLTAWKWIESGIKTSTPSIQANTGLVKQARLPKIIFPTVMIFTNTFKFFVSLVVMIVLLWIFGFRPTAAYAALPILLLAEFIFIVGVAYAFAAIHPFMPDVSILLDNGMRLLFFLSGIFFSGESLSEPVQRFFYINPLSHLIESYRHVLLYGQAPRWEGLLALVLVGLVSMSVGVGLMFRFDRTYPRLAP